MVSHETKAQLRSSVTVRQGILETLKFRGSPKIAENYNFYRINFHGIDTKFLAIRYFSSSLYLNIQ